MPAFPFLTKVWQACSPPPTLCLLFCIPAVRIKRKKMNVISLYVSILQCSLVVLEPSYCHPPSLSSLSNPPSPRLEKKGEKFKAFLSAGICLCTPNVQSMTLSLIIHVTTSWAVRALARTPPNHYGATGLMEESTLISSEESNGDIFQPLCSSPHSPALTPLSRLLLTPPGERL